MTEKAKLTLEAMTEKAKLKLEAMTEKAKRTLEAMTCPAGGDDPEEPADEWWRPRRSVITFTVPHRRYEIKRLQFR